MGQAYRGRYFLYSQAFSDKQYCYLTGGKLNVNKKSRQLLEAKSITIINTTTLIFLD